MNRWSLRGAHAGVTLATLAACFSVEAAYAHLEVRPGFVEQGAVVELSVELPQLRPGSPPVRLELEGDGIEVLAAQLLGTLGVETRWSVRLRAEAEPGVVPIVLRAVYSDGESVEVDQQLTVVPGDEAEPGIPWPAAVGGVLVAISLAAVTLVLRRRKA